MKQHLPIRTLFTAAALLALSISRDLHAQTRRALLIGIDHYDYFPVAASSRRVPIGPLDGAVNDAESMRDVLRDRFNFDNAHIVLLQNHEATRDRIISAIERLVEEAQPGDVVVFYFAGHGSQRMNSGSRPTGLDQTIVPVDANTGVFDIRNKELARLFWPAVQKGVILTLIFDSCHSGAIARGVGVPYKERWAGPDPRDARDSVVPPAPEDHGALVVSAAQDFETAGEAPDNSDGLPHGVFTSALLSVLRSPALGEPATRIYRQVKAMMQSTGRPQEPVLAGKQREQQPLLGGAPGATLGVTTVAVLKRNDDGTVDVQGGLAIGLRVDAELVPLGHRRDTAAVRLKVMQVHGMNRSTAEVIRGSPASIHYQPPDLFEIDKWAPGPTAGVRVWVPPALDGSALAQLTSTFAELRTAGGIEWVEDPAEIPADSIPLAVLQWRDGAWTLEVGKRVVASLAQPLTAQAIRSSLSHTPGKLRLFVLLPPSRQLLAHISFGSGSPNDLVQAVTDRGEADYLLMGRLREGHVEYAWERPYASREMANSSTLPVRTDWTVVTPGGQMGEDSSAALVLVDEALRLAKVRSWLFMEVPPQGGEFPYHLALRRSGTSATLTEGPVHDGEWYGLVLQADSVQLTASLEKRWVYVFAIDSHGTSTLLFPLSNVLNRLPYDTMPNGKWPLELRLGRDSLFSIGPPFGIDTYVLLTSDQAVPTDALEWEGVQRGASRGGVSPLVSLLLGNSAATRSPHPPVPADWSLERLPLLSAPKPAEQGP